MEEKIICHDCGKEIEKNEEVMQYEAEGKIFVKCKACHQKDPILRNFRKAEVYSRIVGYIRPVQQWHAGKQAEFEDRKEFFIKK
jgi:anaerobic ribonucleoside-triphosphate reductase